MHEANTQLTIEVQRGTRFNIFPYFDPGSLYFDFCLASNGGVNERLLR